MQVARAGLVILVACGRSNEVAPPPPAVAVVAVAADAATARADAPPAVPRLQLGRCSPAELPPRIPRKVLSEEEQLMKVFGRGGGGAGYGSWDQTTVPAANLDNLGAAGGIGAAQGAPGLRNDYRANSGLGAGVPRLEFPLPQVQGKLDPTIARRVLQQQRAKLLACYTRQLVAEPMLDGVVALQFVVEPDGTVAAATASGLRAGVASCVADVVRAIVLPKWADAGIATVHANLRFHPGSGYTGPGHDDSRGSVAAPPAAHVADAHGWTPYAAAENLAPVAVAGAAAQALAPVVQQAIPKLQSCFSAQTGSLRAMLSIATDGSVHDARVGGLGDPTVEACVARALVGQKLAPPPSTPAEIACDFTLGEAKPWRVSIDAGYTVLEVSATDVKQHGAVIDLVKPLAGIDVHATTFVIVAEPGVTGAMLDKVMRKTVESSATLIAVREEAGPPQWLAMGPDGRMYDADVPEAQPATIDARDGARACIGAKLLDSIDKLATACATQPCSTITIGLEKTATIGDIAPVTRAARDAGFDRLRLAIGARCSTR